MQLDFETQKFTATLVGASGAVLTELPLPPSGLIGYVEGVVVGRSSTDFRMWHRAALLERSGGTWSALAIVDLPVIPATGGAAGWSIANSIASNTLSISVTGAGTITWHSRLAFKEIGF